MISSAGQLGPGVVKNETWLTYKIDKQPRKKRQMKVESHTDDRAEVTKEKKKHSKQDLLPCNWHLFVEQAKVLLAIQKLYFKKDV